MDPNRMKRIRRQLRRQVLWGRTTLLAVLAVTLINQLLLWMDVEYHFLFSAAMPYYLNWTAGQLTSGAFKAVATVVTLGLYATYVFCLLRYLEPDWTRAVVGLYAADTVLLIVFAMVMLDNPLSCLLEVLVHGIALVLLVQACSAQSRLIQMKRRESHA